MGLLVKPTILGNPQLANVLVSFFWQLDTLAEKSFNVRVPSAFEKDHFLRRLKQCVYIHTVHIFKENN